MEEKKIQYWLWAIALTLFIYLFIEVRGNALQLAEVKQKMEHVIAENRPPYATVMDKVRASCMSPELTVQMYQMMKDTHEILEKNKVTYWIEAGTLLGAVRSKGMIAWDNDIDIDIEWEDELKFQNSIEDFEKLGYTVIEDENYRIVATGKQQIRKPLDHTKYPFIDVAVMRKSGDKLIYRNLVDVRAFPTAFFAEKELFPLKLYQFGGIKVWGPQDPHGYLDRYFGDWDEYGVVYTNESGDLHSNFLRIKLSDELRKPAMPFGPLQDRVQP